MAPLRTAVATESDRVENANEEDEGLVQPSETDNPWLQRLFAPEGFRRANQGALAERRRCTRRSSSLFSLRREMLESETSMHDRISIP